MYIRISSLNYLVEFNHFYLKKSEIIYNFTGGEIIFVTLINSFILAHIIHFSYPINYVVLNIEFHSSSAIKRISQIEEIKSL